MLETEHLIQETDSPGMTPLQARLAQTALGLTLSGMGELCDVSTATVHRVTTGDPAVTARTIRKMRRALEAAGIEFLDGDGVRLK